MNCLLTVVLTYDEPDCGGAADAFVEQLERASETAFPEHKIRIAAFPVSHTGERHHDIIRQALLSIQSTGAVVFSFLKDHNPQEYIAVKQMFKNSPVIHVGQVLTHLANFEDVSLVIQNLIRVCMDQMEKASKLQLR